MLEKQNNKKTEIKNNSLKDPILIYVKLLEFMEKEKIDPREMAIGCKIYESIYNEQSKYFNLENF